MLVAKVWHHCESRNLHGRTVRLKIKYADFQQTSRSRTIATGFTTMGEVEAIIRALLEPPFPTTKGIRLLGVTLSSFGEEAEAESKQLRLKI